MVYDYSNSISAPVGILRMPLFATMAGIRRLFGIVQGGFMPSPKRPKRMSPKFLTLCALLILCFSVSSPSAGSEATLNQLLTTSSMTCMELQKRSRRSYSERSCSFTLLYNGPAVYAGSWECRFEPTTIVAFSFVDPQEIPGFCLHTTDFCKIDEWKIFVSWYKEKKTDADRCKDI